MHFLALYDPCAVKPTKAKPNKAMQTSYFTPLEKKHVVPQMIWYNQVKLLIYYCPLSHNQKIYFEWMVSNYVRYLQTLWRGGPVYIHWDQQEIVVTTWKMSNIAHTRTRARTHRSSNFNVERLFSFFFFLPFSPFLLFFSRVCVCDIFFFLLTCVLPEPDCVLLRNLFTVANPRDHFGKSKLQCEKETI